MVKSSTFSALIQTFIEITTTMKRTITLVSLLISTISFAQLPTITATNQMPAIDDTIFYTDASTFGFDPDGSGGAVNVIWDYTGLTPTGAVDFWYVDPAGTPEAANFTSSTIAQANSVAAGYEYFENDASSINRWGYSGASSLYYNPSFARYTFPITPGVIQSDTYVGTMSALGAGEDSVTIANGNYQANPDAYGTLSLPPVIFGGQPEVFDSVIRVHVIEQFQIIAWLFGTPAIVINVSDDYYFYFDEQTQEPIVIYGVTTDDAGGTPQTVLRYQNTISGTAGGGGATPTIATTNDVTPATWCESVATILTVNFVATGTMNAGNVYTAEISDAAGSFASPVSIGTLNSSASGNLTINAIAPGSLVAGTGYRIRVTASDPATTGGDNTTDLVIDPCTSSINELDGATIGIYPNPTENSFAVASDSAIDGLVITDMNGRVVKTFEGGQNNFDVSDLTEGVYFVKVTQNATVKMTRLVIR